MAVFSLKDTATFFTPGTACRLACTVCGQAAQYMFSTASVTVFSPAKATGEASTAPPNVRDAKSFNMGSLHSRVEKQGCEKIKSERDDDKCRAQDKPDRHHPIR